MNLRKLPACVLVGVIGTILLSGCGKNPIKAPKENLRPTISLTRAPYNQSTRFDYSYVIDWVGYDPDGKVAYYLYTVDPPSPTAFNPNPDSVWIQTTSSEKLINFSATKPDSSKPHVNGSSDFHTFVVKAVDNGGLGGPLQSAPLVRSFFTYTVAPTVQILDPPPSDRGRDYVTPSVLVQWTGTDDDGIFDNKKPVKYKWILLTQNTEVSFQEALQFPDSVRTHYAARNWAGWDSTSADTTQHQFTNLVPLQDYMFVVVAFDEAGAYSPVFSQNSNMLNMRVTFAASGGPLFTVFNDFFNYTYKAPVYSTAPQYVIKIEVPAGDPIPINWTAVPFNPGSIVSGYRWTLDIDDLSDQTPRTNERTDLKHWSQQSTTSSATVGPFAGGETHFFYIEGIDNNGLKSLATVEMFSVQSDLGKPLLIVDDTRFKVDAKPPGAACVDPPKSGHWPDAAECDTFLFAHGGAPWRCYPTGTLTRPGIFAGYKFDTIGTRTGQSEVRVPLAILGHYSHVIWMTDGSLGANSNDPGTNLASSITALRYMSTPGRANSLAAYLRQGGQVWMVGGGCAEATTQPYNSTRNDTSPPAAGLTYTANPLEVTPSPPELQPGRFMYDVAHWQSQIKITGGLTNQGAVQRILGRWDSTAAVPAAYAHLPAVMHTRDASGVYGDTLPPNRSFGDFFNTYEDIEYLSQPNFVTEDVDPSPLVNDEQSTLDTLYQVTGQTFMPKAFNRYNIVMTRYVGPAYQYPSIFTGFSIWGYGRNDCISLVDAVLRDMWGMVRSPAALRSAPAASFSRARATPVAMAQPRSPAPIPIQRVTASPVMHVGRTPDR